METRSVIISCLCSTRANFVICRRRHTLLCKKCRSHQQGERSFDFTRSFSAERLRAFYLWNFLEPRGYTFGEAFVAIPLIENDDKLFIEQIINVGIDDRIGFHHK